MADELNNPSTKQGTGFVQDFRRYFLRGLAVFLPPLLTLLILYQLFLFLDNSVGYYFNYWVRLLVVAPLVAESRTELPKDGEGWIQLDNRGPYVPERVQRLVASRTPSGQAMPKTVPELYEKYALYQYWEPYHLSFIGLLLAAVIIYFIGHFLATFIGRSLWRGVEYTVYRLPIVRAVYPYVKQFIDVLLSERKHEYNRVVVVEYPRRGIWSLGLVTGEGMEELVRATGTDLLTVFIPYTPYSVTGYTITVPRSEVMDLSLSVDEAIRFIVTGGVIRPKVPALPAHPSAPVVPAPASPAGAVHQRPDPERLGKPIRVGTRGSQLARRQAEWVVAQLRGLAMGREIELVEIKTGGDRAADARLREIGGEGIFTKEIELALLANEIDVAVHSLKDLPTTPVPGLMIAAVPRRAPALDVLVSPQFRDWGSLPAGAHIGTSSPRRRCQLLRLRNDLIIEEIRGNVPTRLGKIEELGLAGIVLAHAGLYRLGLENHITYYFTPDEMLPAPGQGALGIECRSDDREFIDLLAHLDDLPTRHVTTAERAVLAALQGGCHMPLGTYATASDGQLGLRAGIFSTDGTRHLIDSLAGPAPQAESLGRQLADRLVAAGAKEIG